MSEKQIMEQYPEHAKMILINDQSQAVGEFLETSGYMLCEFDEGTHEWMPVNKTVERMLADHFGIDLDKIEAEKRAMLESLRQS